MEFNFFCQMESVFNTFVIIIAPNLAYGNEKKSWFIFRIGGGITRR